MQVYFLAKSCAKITHSCIASDPISSISITLIKCSKKDIMTGKLSATIRVICCISQINILILSKLNFDMNLNVDAKKENTYDAIVVGTGISGGWAAKELTEKGLKTLVLERGRMVKHPDYPTATKDPWDFENGGRPTQEDLKKQGVQARTGYTVRQDTKHWFVNDLENPYTEVNRFDWMRGYHVGGRSITWGRQSYRLGDLDFEA